MTLKYNILLHPKKRRKKHANRLWTPSYSKLRNSDTTFFQNVIKEGEKKTENGRNISHYDYSLNLKEASFSVAKKITNKKQDTPYNWKT